MVFLRDVTDTTLHTRIVGVLWVFVRANAPDGEDVIGMMYLGCFDETVELPFFSFVEDDNITHSVGTTAVFIDTRATRTTR